MPRIVLRGKNRWKLHFASEWMPVELDPLHGHRGDLLRQMDGIGISTAINCVRQFQETDSLAPGQMGGHRPKAIRGAHHAWLVERIQERDFCFSATPIVAWAPL